MHKNVLIVLFIVLFVIFSANIAQTYKIDKNNSDKSNFLEYIKTTKQYKRAEWFNKERAYPNDTISVITFNRELTKELSKYSKQLNKNNYDSSKVWTSLGPIGVQNGNNIYSGRVRGLAIHPDNPEIVYIGAASGGLWKTIDGGDSWIDLSDKLPICTFGAIAIDPSNTDIIFAGTGEAIPGWGSYNIYDGRGLFKSEDGGVSWEKIPNGFGLPTHFSSIYISPHNPETVYAALSGGYIYNKDIISNKGIWKSNDGGTTWIHVYDSSKSAFDVIGHPTNPNTVYAAIENKGFYVSDNYGETWELRNSGLPEGIERIQIVISKSNPQKIYAMTYKWYSESSHRSKLFITQNEGKFWAPVAHERNFGSNGLDQGWYDMSLAINPSDENNIFVGNILLSKTVDGTNFEFDNNQIHADIHTIAFAPSNNKYLYLGCDGGVYKSKDGGLTWESKNNGISTLQLYGISSHPTNKDIIIAGSQDNYDFITKDHGKSVWQTIRTGGDVKAVFFDPMDPDIIYTSAYGSRLYKSVNGGIKFNYLNLNIDGYPSITPQSFLIHPYNNSWLYLVTDKVWKSEDGGYNWNEISPKISYYSIKAIHQSNVNPDIMIVAGYHKGLTPPVFITSNEGQNWIEVTDSIPGEQRVISKVLTHPTDSNTVFIVRSGYGSGKIYRSNDLGNKWENITGNLPDVPHSDMFIDPNNSSHYYVANDFGVYGSIDSGISWQRIGQGMPFVVAVDLDYFDYGGDRFLRVATYGRGAYELNLNLVTNIEKKQFVLDNNYELKQNYPNPFNPTTNIEYTLPSNSIVKIKVYDILGKEVKTLVSENKIPGNYSVEFDASNFSSGVYYYQLQAGDFIQTNKMLLIK